MSGLLLTPWLTRLQHYFLQISLGLVCRDGKVTNCYFYIFSLSYKRFSEKILVGVTTVRWHMFSVIFRFQKIWEKNMQKIWFSIILFFLKCRHLWWNKQTIFLEVLLAIDNARPPIQFQRESQPQQLKRWIFLKNRPFHFHISSTSVIRLVKQN